jgi:tetratricopeptide (TPR) repeat protein
MSNAFERAVAAHRAGDFRAAEQGYLEFPNHSRALHNLGVLYSADGKFDQAEESFRKALAISPDYAPSRLSLATQLLAQGRYAEGWPLHEARRQDPNAQIPQVSFDFPEWRGQSLTGKRLIVVGEQGFGDQIMLARFIPRLAEMGAEVVFVCSPALARLFERLGPEIVAGTRTASPPRGDYWVLLNSVPLHVGATLATLPPPVDLGQPNGSGSGVGVKVDGAPAHVNDANRSLSPQAAARARTFGRDLSPEATGARDFRETAEIIATLDKVISVDTSVAHLAATLGKPTWILLPARGADWRWLRDRDDSPWYPSVRLLRQQTPGDWSAELDAAERALP